MSEAQKKELKTVGDVVESPMFRGFVFDEFSRTMASRRNRPSARAGFSYKRDWYDRFGSDVLSADFFIKNCIEIWSKKSPLPPELRNVINHVCTTAYLKTLDYSK